jgi:hypothetical protein
MNKQRLVVLFDGGAFGVWDTFVANPCVTGLMCETSYF